MQDLFLLCEYATLNGGERSMLATLPGVQAAGFTPVVMAPPKGPLANALTARGVELLPFSCRAADGSRLPQKRVRTELATALSRSRPALLHANSLAMGRLSGPVAKQLGLRSLSHVRDIVRLSVQAAADVNCHTRLLAVSHATRAFHVTGGLMAEKMHVLNNGVDLTEFRPQSPTGYLHRELGLPADAQLIGTIGQIGLRKGQDVLLHAAARIAGRTASVHYLVLGERNSEKEESRCFERGLHDVAQEMPDGRVHFLGVRHDVCRLLGELTLLVHPARQEPLGRVLLEAAAAGLPIIATDVGGTPEIFPPDSHSAVIVPPDDTDALGNAVLEVLGDVALRQRLAAAARRRAVERFDIQESVGQLLRHYRALVEE
jgi:glycosyltransferase involved in cell wall biosynthesis